jgi:hypothetical protein
MMMRKNFKPVKALKRLFGAFKSKFSRAHPRTVDHNPPSDSPIDLEEILPETEHPSESTHLMERNKSGSYSEKRIKSNSKGVYPAAGEISSTKEGSGTADESGSPPEDSDEDLNQGNDADQGTEAEKVHDPNAFVTFNSFANFTPDNNASARSSGELSGGIDGIDLYQFK